MSSTSCELVTLSPSPKRWEVVAGAAGRSGSSPCGRPPRGTPIRIRAKNSDATLCPKPAKVAEARHCVVDDVVKSANFYRDKLGFHYDRFWGEPPCFCMVSR